MNNAPALYMQGDAEIDGVSIFTSLDLQVAAGQGACLLGPSWVCQSKGLETFGGGGGVVCVVRLRCPPGVFFGLSNKLC